MGLGNWDYATWKGIGWREVNTLRVLRKNGQLINTPYSVVQRQLWLIHNKKMRPSAAYDQARHEFYEHRYKEALARRIAVEEALATGAYFGKNALQIGMELEDKAWEDWRAWAMKEAETSQQLRAAQYGPMEADDDAIVATADDIEPIAEEAVEVVADPVKS